MIQLIKSDIKNLCFNSISSNKGIQVDLLTTVVVKARKTETVTINNLEDYNLLLFNAGYYSTVGVSTTSVCASIIIVVSDFLNQNSNNLYYSVPIVFTANGNSYCSIKYMENNDIKFNTDGNDCKIYLYGLK